MKSTLTAPLALGVAGSLAIAVPTNAGALQSAPREKAAGCEAFAWPVANERSWFADQNLRRTVSDVRLSRIDRAVDLTLEPSRTVHFFLPPENRPPPDSYSGEVTFFGVPRPGLW
ncbi:hypothetical protein [Roseiarcus sp.]|uniref:hypothetical protein n=1 Tax=Roseiarcus sp. TaxID=1969460 RepID=UPI003F9BD77F